MKLELEIKSECGNWTINLGGESMDELVEKLFEWQLWENQTQDYFKKRGVLDKHKNSGWYIMNNELKQE